MAKAKIYGPKSCCVPNRQADFRRRNNAYKKGREFAENDFHRARDKQERKLIKQKGEEVC